MSWQSIAQSRADTTVFEDKDPMRIMIRTFDVNGALREVNFGTRIDTPMLREEIFMQALTAPDVRSKFIMDSTVTYDASGSLIDTNAPASFKLLELDYVFKPGYIRSKHINEPDLSAPDVIFFKSGSISIKRKIVLEGSIDSTSDLEIKLKSHFPDDHKIKLFTHSDKIQHPDSIILTPGGPSSIPVIVKFTPIIDKEMLIIENEYGEKSEVLIEINGHDLTSNDFHPSLKESKVVILENRKKLVLKSDGMEKLIRLTREGEVIQHVPYGKKRMEVNLKGFKSGLYVLEAIDLGRDEVKYARLDLKL
ncbi:MAG: hypothetical protein HKN76_03505 [Saprospiraceae bacterium]|nr:hypothetical protein [Saprospiraceae bacterium]